MLEIYIGEKLKIKAKNDQGGLDRFDLELQQTKEILVKMKTKKRYTV